MKRSLRAVGAVVCLAMVAAFAVPQDGLGKKRGGGGGDSGGGNSGGGNSGGGGNTGRVDRGGSRTGGGNNSGGSVGTGGTSGRVTQGGSTSGNYGGNRTGSGQSGTVILPDDPQRTLRRPSRSGNVSYGSQNNVRFDDKSYRINRARTGFLHNLDRKIDRTEGRVGVIVSPLNGAPWGYRWGYCHYNRNWRDDNFWYPYYIFDPFAYNRFVCSPWYYYPFLPPYINTTRIIVVNNYYGYNNWSGDPYYWQAPDNGTRYSDDRDSRYDRDLDYSIEDLVTAFQRNDRRSASHLIPRSGSVAIYLDGQYNYSLNPDDFYDLFMDAVENAKTTRYMIEDVRYGRGVAKVRARHDYEDPWGRSETVWHEFTLEQDRGGYVIREFGTDYDLNR